MYIVQHPPSIYSSMFSTCTDSSIYTTSTDSSVYCAPPILPFTAPLLNLPSIVLFRFFHLQHLHWLFRILCSLDFSLYSTSTDSSVYCDPPILPYTALPLTLPSTVLPWFFHLQDFHWHFRLQCSPEFSSYVQYLHWLLRLQCFHWFFYYSTSTDSYIFITFIDHRVHVLILSLKLYYLKSKSWQ